MGTGFEEILMKPQQYESKPILMVPRTIGPQNFPITVALLINQVLDDNAHKHKPAAWREISVEEHISHARQHIQQWINLRTENLIREEQGMELLEEDEPHLLHALTRLAFAAELENQEGENK